MAYKYIITKKEGGVATLILNRPEKLNSVNEEMIEEMLSAQQEFAEDSRIKVLILTGAGRAFSAGADHEALSSKSDEPLEFHNMVKKFHNFSLNLRNMDKPTIAAVNGIAAGATCNHALACDLIIASENARFSQIFVNIGGQPDSGGSYFLPRLVGVAKACELIFTGKTIDAREAERIGLINQVVAPENLESVTGNLALKLAGGPSLALGLAKKSLYQSLGMDLAGSLDCELRNQTLCFISRDFQEGLKAFTEKRKPQFEGK